MTERYEDLGGQPTDAHPTRKPRHFTKPLCAACRHHGGWIEDEDGRPIRRCPCRLTPEDN